MQPTVGRVLTATSVNRVIRVHDSVEAAEADAVAVDDAVGR